MNSKKVLLDDLLEDTEMGSDMLTKPSNPVYDLIKDEINEFLDRPAEKRVFKKNTTFFSTAPKSALKEGINTVIKSRTVQEERIQKALQFDFDRKMQRINKIKSKDFRRLNRRDKIRKETALDSDNEESEDDSEASENSSKRPATSATTITKPIIEFDVDSTEEEFNHEQKSLVRNAFEVPEDSSSETDFVIEKREVVDAEAPQANEIFMPGWDDWAGEGLANKKCKANTFVDFKEGIKAQDRKDFLKSNVIINENITIPEKYKASLPYGYNTKEYITKVNIPVSLETNSTRVFNRFVKLSSKEEEIAGKEIAPAEFEPEY
ncbi:hypothetical protein ENBRE01_0194 [Enteropsectra breve]|nr:hypothetical protein ENBRE01_0194 [Enteropsectra breve]